MSSQASIKPPQRSSKTVSDKNLERALDEGQLTTSQRRNIRQLHLKRNCTASHKYYEKRNCTSPQDCGHSIMKDLHKWSVMVKWNLEIEKSSCRTVLRGKNLLNPSTYDSRLLKLSIYETGYSTPQLFSKLDK